MSYKINLPASGHEFEAEPEQSVLDAALAHGISLTYGCRSGSCGACKARVLEGTVDYPFGLPLALSQEEAAQGHALLCQAVPRSDLVLAVDEIASAEQITVKNLPCRVERMEQLCHDVMRLYLKLPRTERLQFLAGQYIDVLMKDGRRRSYSIANAPHDDEFIELHIRNVPGGDFSHHVFTEMKEKELLRIEAPLGSFTLREDSQRPIIFMAGGTGFAPIKGIIEHAFALGIRRPMHLFWGARARRDLYLEALPEQWQKEHNNFRYTPVLSDPLAEDHWQGTTGYVHEAIVAQYPDLSDYEVYAGGPPRMVEAGASAFFDHQLYLANYFADSFEYAKD